MAFQSLYRRFRPQRFGDVIGQTHLVSALQNAVREDRVGHAYLLSGPRGTGKTSTARLLAKALNCQNLGADGEPCTTCDSCQAIEHGSSMDLVELDAASNRGIDDIKELVRSVAMGTPGRRKVYILDEVHMLTPQASSALLKTLEEPPGHVVFVLATTDPQKVFATIRSRTQHIELSLVGAELMASHVRDIAGLAALDITDDMVEHVVRRGGGSVRDTLSALDQVVAAGGIGDDHMSLDDIVGSLISRDPGAALAAVAQAVSSGADPRDLTEHLTRHLRDVFLVQQNAAPPELSADLITSLAEHGRLLGAAATVRALEQLGSSIVDMRQAADTRLVLEVTLVRLTSPDASSGLDALVQRIERLEAALEAGPNTRTGVRPEVPPSSESATGAESAPRAASVAGAASVERAASGPSSVAPPPPPPPTSPSSPTDSASAASVGGSGSKMSAARQALAEAQDVPVAAVPATPPPTPAPPGSGVSVPSSESPVSAAPAAESKQAGPVDAAPSEVSQPGELAGVVPWADETPAMSAPVADAGAASPPTAVAITSAWVSHLQPKLSTKARARFQVGEFVDGAAGTVNYVLPNSHYLDRCIEMSDDVASVIAAHFGSPVDLEVTLGEVHIPATASAEVEVAGNDDVDLRDFVAGDLTDAPAAAVTGAERLQAGFPGASIVEPDAEV